MINFDFQQRLSLWIWPGCGRGAARLSKLGACSMLASPPTMLSSPPDGTYDRPVVILSTKRIRGIHLLRGGQQVICLAGATLDELENRLRPLGREPHSVIGSSCIGASVIGGICNNSGGALIRRGPAYTEYALFARVTEGGRVTLHNNLGVRLGNDPEAILQSLQDGQFTDSHIVDDERAASPHDYERQVREISSDRPARFDADPNRLFEASGSAGRIVVFAVRVDTFPAAATFYIIGTNDTQGLSNIRCCILRDFSALPVTGEYIHRTSFDLAVDYGKNVFLAIELLSTKRLPALFSLKTRIDRLVESLVHQRERPGRDPAIGAIWFGSTVESVCPDC